MTKLMLMPMTNNNPRSEFHGYVGSFAMLNNGKTVRILGGHDLKLFVKYLDGSIRECYHDDIKYIMEE